MKFFDIGMIIYPLFLFVIIAIGLLCSRNKFINFFIILSIAGIAWLIMYVIFTALLNLGIMPCPTILNHNVCGCVI
jgi:hypothetical protein